MSLKQNLRTETCNTLIGFRRVNPKNVKFSSKCEGKASRSHKLIPKLFRNSFSVIFLTVALKYQHETYIINIFSVNRVSSVWYTKHFDSVVLKTFTNRSLSSSCLNSPRNRSMRSDRQTTTSGWGLFLLLSSGVVSRLLTFLRLRNRIIRVIISSVKLLAFASQLFISRFFSHCRPTSFLLPKCCTRNLFKAYFRLFLRYFTCHLSSLFDLLTAANVLFAPDGCYPLSKM